MEFIEPELGACEAGSWSFIGSLEQIDGKIKAIGGGMCAGGTDGASVTLDPGEMGGGAIPIGNGDCAKIFVHYREGDNSCVLAGFSVFEKDEMGSIGNPLYQVGSGLLTLSAPMGFPMFDEFNFSPTKSEPGCIGDPQVCAVAEGTEIVHWEQFGVPVALGEGQEPVPCGPDDGFTCSVLRAHRHGDDDQSCERHLDWIVRRIE